MRIREWLALTQQHMGDDRWLATHENDLHDVTRRGIYTPHELQIAVELLNLIFPHYALKLFHTARWSERMFDALMQAMDLRDNDMLMEIYRNLGESKLVAGESNSAQEAFINALKRARDGEAKPAMLAASIGLIRLQALNLEDNFLGNLFSSALDLSYEVQDETLTAILHQALCLAYLTSRQESKALEYGQTAYGYWSGQKNTLEMAKTAFLLSSTYRSARQFKLAATWLDLAAEHFEDTEYIRQHVLIAYERGVQYREQDNLDAAQQWLEITLQEAITINWVAYIALSHHMLGIIQGKLGQYEKSEVNLKQSLHYWQNLNDVYEFTAVHHAMGWLEIKRQNYPEARHWLNRGLDLCERIPNAFQRTYMERLIRETIQEIPEVK
jgi:tetratricopeptide (TPR) repeat protein